jgi:hypothetical protein
MGVVFDEFVFALDQSNHSVFEHFLEENAFLRMHNLIIAIFEFLVDFDVLYVEERIMLKPLLIRTFVVQT